MHASSRMPFIGVKLGEFMTLSALLVGDVFASFNGFRILYKQLYTNLSYVILNYIYVFILIIFKSTLELILEFGC